MLTDAKVLNVVTMPAAKGKINFSCFIIDHIKTQETKFNFINALFFKDMTVFATRMDVTSDHGVWETTNTMDLDQNSKLIPPNHLPSLLNSSLPMEQKTEI